MGVDEPVGVEADGRATHQAVHAMLGGRPAVDGKRLARVIDVGQEY